MGEYVADHGIATDIVRVGPGGIYWHIYQEPGGEEFKNKGTWELEFIKGEPAVVFSGFKTRWRKLDRPLAPAIYPAFVERSFSGRIRLSLSAGEGYYYIKKDPEEN
jgi:hypothetical protein